MGNVLQAIGVSSLDLPPERLQFGWPGLVGLLDERDRHEKRLFGVSAHGVANPAPDRWIGLAVWFFCEPLELL